jgi:hypothetical protein
MLEKTLSTLMYFPPTSTSLNFSEKRKKFFLFFPKIFSSKAMKKKFERGKNKYLDKEMLSRKKILLSRSYVNPV